MTAPDPLTLVVTTAGPYPLLPNEVSTIAILSAKANGAGAVTFDRQECKGVGTYPKTEAFNAGTAAIGTGPYKLVRFTKGDRIVLERNDGYWGEKPAWQRVIFRPITSAGPRVAALLAGDVDLIENVPIQDLERIKANAELQGRAGAVEPRDLSAFRLHRRCAARRRGEFWRQEFGQESVPRQTRARGDLQGDRSRRDRRAHHGRGRGAGGRAAAAHDVRRQQGHEGAQGRCRRRRRSCWRKPATRTASR